MRLKLYEMEDFGRFWLIFHKKCLTLHANWYIYQKNKKFIIWDF